MRMDDELWRGAVGYWAHRNVKRTAEGPPMSQFSTRTLEECYGDQRLSREGEATELLLNAIGINV